LYKNNSVSIAAWNETLKEIYPKPLVWQISPIHPGEHLAEFLEEYGISQYRLAKKIHVPARRINKIVKCQRSITADPAIRLGHYFGNSP